MKRLEEKLLNLPILYKVLIANTLVIVVGAVVGTWLTRELSQHSVPEQLIAIFVLAGIILSISVNFLILKAALQPLAALQKTVGAVYRGDLMARVARTPLGDPIITHLRDALNSMLEEISSSHKRLKDLSTKVLNVQEEERKRIARELHDETSQALTVLMIELKMLEKAKPEDRKKKITELRDYTSQILDGVRRLILELRPSDLDELGLIPALRSYTKDWSKKINSGIDFQATKPRGRLPNNVEVALYRVVQEALTNVAKHSGATSVWISMRCEDSLGMVTIRDNGRGFNMDEVMKSKESGLGLFGMMERMSTVGGELKINTTPSQGTEVVAKYTYRENGDG